MISKIPTLSVLNASASGILLGQNYEHVQVFGADLASTVGKFGIRAEAAYTLAPDSDGRDPLRFNREIYAVAGADHSPIENLNFNLQFLYKHVFDFHAAGEQLDPNLRLLASQENLIANQLSSNQYGLSFRPNYKMWNDTLELEVAYVQWFGTPGGMLRPKATYAFNDHFKGVMGAEKYFGVSNSFFGRLSPVSSVFTELQLSL